MGLLDDLAMGFGFKERTEDYDARTARGIALDDRYGDDHIAQMRARQGYETTSYDPRATPIGKNDQGRMVYRYGYDTSTGPAAQYLGSHGYDEGYTPSMGGTDPSPTPYAIGPVSMDQPLPSFGLLGLFTNGLGGLFSRDSGSEMGPARTTVRPRLRPDDLNAPLDTHVPMDAGMDRFEDPEARAVRAALASGMPTPDLSPKVIKKLSEETQESLLDIPDAARITVGMAPESVNKPDPAFPIDLSKKYSEAALGQMDDDMIDYLKRVELEEAGYKYLDKGPHAGKYIDANGRIVSF